MIKKRLKKMPPQLRVEFLLPSSYNDGQSIESKKYKLIKDKIVDKFGGISVHPASVSGIWRCDGQIYYDNCYRFEVTVEKNDFNRNYLEELKEELKVEFKQHEIYMICTEVDRI